MDIESSVKLKAVEGGKKFCEYKAINCSADGGVAVIECICMNCEEMITIPLNEEPPEDHACLGKTSKEATGNKETEEVGSIARELRVV